MSDKRATTRELERDLRRQPENLPLRLRLAAAYRADDRKAEAVQLYRSVAVAYHGQRRLAQAIAVCRSVLELEPGQPETLALLSELEAMRPQDDIGDAPTGHTPAYGMQQLAVLEDATLSDDSAPLASPPVPAGAQTPRAGVRVLEQEVAVRDLQPVRRAAVPVRPLMIPTTPPRTGLGQLVPPPLPRPSTQMTPTPLPTPVPYHEAGDDSQSEITVPPTTIRAPSRDTATDHGPAPDWHARADDAETRLAGPRTGSAHDDDAMTRVAGGRAGSGWPPQPPPPLQARASSPSLDLSADLETRRRPRIDPAELELLGAATPLTGPMVRVELPRAGDTQPDRRAVVVEPHEGWPEEATDPRESPREQRDTQRSASTVTEETHTETTHDTGKDHEPAPSHEHEHDELPTGVGDNVEPSHLFEHSFVPTLAHLGPDGTPLEGPGGLLGVFTTLPDHARAELERTMIVRHPAAGEVILREGDRGDSCFVIGEGEVRVLKSDPLGRAEGGGGEPIEVARLGEGSMFGEFALLADRRRHATVEAVTACELYEVPRRALRELAATFPEVGPALERFYRERLLATLLATAPIFQALPEDQRAGLLARFVPLHANSGQTVVQEGERSGGLYLIVLGAVEIVKRGPDGRTLLLATLREGAYVGEMSLLRGQPANASVLAAGPVELAFLPPRDFYEVVAGNPTLWNAMRREVGARQLENAKILAGDTSAV